MLIFANRKVASSSPQGALFHRKVDSENPVKREHIRPNVEHSLACVKMLFSLVLLCAVRKMTMSFGKRLAELRRRRGLTQQQLCELVNVHVTQLRNYEGDRSQPTLEVIRKLALALDVTADELVFDPVERRPQMNNKELVKQWERIEELPDEDRQALKMLVEGLLLRRQISSLRPTG